MKNSSLIGLVIMGIFWSVCLIYVCATGAASLDTCACSLFANIVYTVMLIFFIREEDDKNGYV